MRYIDILTAFETEIGKIDDFVRKPATDDSLYWLNQAVNKFVKLRFNGDLTHNTGYEETEKRREDLIRLLTTFVTTSFRTATHTDYVEYTVNYPSNFMYELHEQVTITANNKSQQVPVFECTQDSFMYRVTNSLTDFHYSLGKARPIRIRTNAGCELLTDGKYEISRYELTYIREPNVISLDDPYSKYTDFNDSTLYEITKIAAQMYLENTEDKRYQTIATEVATQE